ncbi:type VI secretion system protein TssA [Caldimonas caldifontis]|uniref:Type VI secretion system protein TssA n=1 Tax=Caldimonas caldifontis TaxID=1452508 RepID=A0A2S5ST41_9BURK|nr:type VI secretion system protein TssA [Caldimonas caldifontis]PPE65883.1 type VI secretion system protein TssA [Caldimonas caldifontis]
MDASLLAPLSETHPCGDDLSFSGHFDAIREMRREDDPSLDQGAWVTTLKVADWPGVEALCAQLLRERSKDLRLAMWWTEAAAMQRGYAGLADGLALCASMCELHWEHLHPLPEDGDASQRIGNLAWLLNRVVALSASLPINAARHTLRDLAAARQLQQQMERRPEEASQAAEGRLTLEQVQRAVRETPAEQLLGAVSSIRRCLEQLEVLQRICDAQLGDEGPSFAAAREALDAAADDMTRLCRSVGLHGETAEQEKVEEAVATAAPPKAAAPAAHGLHSREQALQQLREVAAFFRRTEPHSPVAYLADKAARWGNMPLHQWLQTVLKDPGALAHVDELLGVEREHPGS